MLRAARDLENPSEPGMSDEQIRNEAMTILSRRPQHDRQRHGVDLASAGGPRRRLKRSSTKSSIAC